MSGLRRSGHNPQRVAVELVIAEHVYVFGYDTNMK
jgi:hypothetical protein